MTDIRTPVLPTMPDPTRDPEDEWWQGKCEGLAKHDVQRLCTALVISSWNRCLALVTEDDIEKRKFRMSYGGFCDFLVDNRAIPQNPLKLVMPEGMERYARGERDRLIRRVTDLRNIMNRHATIAAFGNGSFAFAIMVPLTDNHETCRADNIFEIQHVSLFHDEVVCRGTMRVAKTMRNVLVRGTKQNGWAALNAELADRDIIASQKKRLRALADLTEQPHDDFEQVAIEEQARLAGKKRTKGKSDRKGQNKDRSEHARP